MIDLYTWSTPNGFKVSMLLEELGLEYRVHPIDISADQQHTPEFRAISPNGKIPAIVDRDGDVSVSDSGAILLYLAEKTGKLLPEDPAQRALVYQWLMFQSAHVGPMIGQWVWFIRSAEEHIPYAINRYLQEGARLLKVLDKQLQETEYVAGDLSIADIALYGWVSLAAGPIKEQAADAVGETPGLDRWLAAMAARPSTAKGMAVPAEFS